MKPLFLGQLLWFLAGYPALASAEPPDATAKPIQAAAAPSSLQGGPELLLFEEFPTVVSAARQVNPAHWSAVPVSQISAEDLHYSGLTHLAEVFRFLPGMDVLRQDRNRHMVGVNGFHEVYSERTLSLIDGRNADSLIFGGSEFQRLPLFLEDLERIEVVRGPGGAAWGANAFTGVINLITKEPEATQGGYLQTTVNEFGDLTTLLRWGDRHGAWAWRTSAGYENWGASGSALEEPLLARDFHHGSRLDGKAAWQPTPSTRLSLGLGHSEFAQGDFEILGYFPMKDNRIGTTRAFAQIEHRFPGGKHGTLRWFSNFADNHQPGLQKSHSSEHEVDSQLDLQLAGGHEFSWGANLRTTHVGTQLTDPQDLQFVFSGRSANEVGFGLFAVDRWRVLNRLTLETQLRADHNSDIERRNDWSGRLAAIFALDATGHQTLRLAVARAFHSPSLASRAVRASRLPLAPGIFLFEVLPAAALESEHTWSLEAGYALVSASGFRLRFDAYYQDFLDLIGGAAAARQLAPQLTIFEITQKNLGGAESKGMSFEVARERPRGRLSAWYAWSDFDTEFPQQVIRAYHPAQHKAGLLGRWSAGNWVLQTQYRFTSATRADSGSFAGLLPPIPSSHRLDLVLTRTLRARSTEVLLGAEDIFDETGSAVFGLGSLTAHETPGRAVFGRFELKF